MLMFCQTFFLWSAKLKIWFCTFDSSIFTSHLIKKVETRIPTSLQILFNLKITLKSSSYLSSQMAAQAPSQTRLMALRLPKLR